MDTVDVIFCLSAGQTKEKFAYFGVCSHLQILGVDLQQHELQVSVQGFVQRCFLGDAIIVDFVLGVCRHSLFLSSVANNK